VSTGWALVIAVLLLMGNAFFVGAEFALISARRTQIEPRAARGSAAAKTTLRAMENVSLMMAGAQLGITLCSIGLGAVAEPALAAAIEPWFSTLGIPQALVHPVAVAIALIIVVSLHMVLGEMVPKNIALAKPERSALLLGPLQYGIVTLLRPVIWLLNQGANVVLRLLRVPVRDEVATAFTRDEVAALVDESRRHGFLDQSEHELLTGALDFVESRVGSLAVPLAQLVTVSDQVTPLELQELCVQTGYSRFPVVTSEQELIGYVHVKDLVAITESKMRLPLERRWVRRLPEVAFDDSIRDVLGTMQRRGVHLVRVNDAQSRAMTGIAMMEDVLEELVGEVAAEQRP
jgi:CBS domain containing-hemolysin-like protein